MNYKALEDLINILVKKSGTSLDSDMSVSEEPKLRSKLSKLLREHESFIKMTTTKQYKDLDTLEIDETKKTYLEKVIQTLEGSLKSLEEELLTFDVKDERGETAYVSALSSIKVLEERKKIFKRELDYAKSKESEESKELSNKLRDLNKEIRNHRKIVDRKRFLEEEIARVKEEILKYRISYENIKNKISSNEYFDNFGKMNDNLVSNSMQEEISNLEKVLEVWAKMPEVLGKKILSAYSDKKEFADIEALIDSLLDKASNEYSLTKDEIDGSNIFQEMDKYIKLISELKSKAKNYDYSNKKVVVYDTEKESYFSSRIAELKERLKSLEERKQTAIDHIKSVKDASDEYKNKRFEFENALGLLKERLNSSSTKKLPIEETKEIDRLIINIEEDISSLRELETGKSEDMYFYKDELRKLDIEIISTRKLLLELEKKLQKVVKDNNTSDVDKLEMLEDRILMIEYNNRLDSLKNQQQYLYVDPSVIKEEIKLIWGRTKEPNSYIPLSESVYDDETETESIDFEEIDNKKPEEEPFSDFEEIEVDTNTEPISEEDDVETLQLDELIEDIKEDL